MRATFEDIPSRKGASSFVAYYRVVPAFPFKWHYHPEYELTLITSGKGTRLVGDNRENFSDGDLVLIGPNVPHTWVSDGYQSGLSGAVVIQFSEGFIGTFLQHPEFESISTLLASSGNGLSFSIDDEKIFSEIRALPDAEPVCRVTGLIHILQRLAGQNSQKLASPYFNPVRGEKNELRINIVCDFLQRNYHQSVSVKEVANLIGLSETAFCKFFKRTTGKTLSQYVNEIRIGYACSLLSGTDKPISDIAYACGFESLTYFNRVFLKLKKMTPRNYRNRMGGYGVQYHSSGIAETSSAINS